MKKGLVVFDVDGVIYKDIFLKKIVRSKGSRKFLKILMLGISFYLNKMSIDKLLTDGYRLAGDFKVEDARNIAKKIKRFSNINETIQILHKEGYYVSLISSGIPNFILKSLAGEIGADSYSGLNIKIKEDKIKAGKIRTISKVKIVEDLLKELNLTWEAVISIGDDPNNIDLLEKSRIGVGFNPSLIVRKKCDIVIEGNDLLEILPFIIPQANLPLKLKKERFYWKREIFRKAVHLLGCAFPLLAVLNRTLIIYILLGTIIIYSFSEVLRYMGISLPIVSYVTRRAQRYNETKGIIIGPMLLALGILAAILFFDFKVYLPAILIVSVSDSLSALIGKKFGKIHIFKLKNRTVQGSTVFFLSSLGILLFTVPAQIAFPAAVIVTLFELIPIYNLDNFIIPLGTGFFLHFTMGL
jgi:dolichol kinase/phosphoserine phosphatase